MAIMAMVSGNPLCNQASSGERGAGEELPEE
jgi:hypothetical protein